MGYRYKYEDLDCLYCTKRRKIGCKFSLCPYIMENLKELNKDKKFQAAVMDAENCKSSHRFTLLHLKKKENCNSSAPSAGFTESGGNGSRYDYKPECKNCIYATPGFVCHSKNDGSCLMDWIKERIYAGC